MGRRRTTTTPPKKPTKLEMYDGTGDLDEHVELNDIVLDYH
jgi:hypothetical protein